MLCVLDGATVPFNLAEGEDDGHGLHSANETEGHRFMAPGGFAVHSASEWQAGLLAKRVIVGWRGERRRRVAEGVAALAAERQLTVVDDPALLDEVAGLVEWPVPLLGRIDAAYMDLPAEVMQVSMRVNQRYFAPAERGWLGSAVLRFRGEYRGRGWAVRRSSRETSGCCAPGSAMRGISGMQTAG